MMSVFKYFYLTKYLIFQTFGLFIIIAAIAAIIFLVLRKLHSLKAAILLSLLFFGIFIFFFVPMAFPGALQYPFFLKTYGPSDGPTIPFKNMIGFFSQLDKMEKVQNIARDPNDIPPPITRTEPATVKIEMETKEVIAEIAPGVSYNFWTFDGTVPGPFLRVKEGDTVELTLKNNPSSVHPHSIDLHAVTGPGGGAAVTTVEPGESKMLKFKALNPGLYIYHCAHPNVAAHMAHGMYGLILVEPKEGLPPVDKEFYVAQGEFYATGNLGKKGLQVFDAHKMLDSQPQYLVFNGKVGALLGNMNAKVGDKVRIFFGNGGVNMISSFHLIGEIFDNVYPEAAIGSEPHHNVQTTAVPAGGATITEFKFDVPGKYILVDHALARLDRGLFGAIQVSGEANKEIYDGDMTASKGH